MKGIVFNLLQEVVERAFGPDTWDDLLDAAGVSGAYTSIGSYDDAEIAALVEAGGAKFGKSPAQVLRWFGESAMPLLKGRFPALFEPHASSRSFILAVNSMIHPEVRKLYAGAACPFFHFRKSEDGAVTVAYSSSRKLCDLAHGFALGAAGIFCEEIAITHRSCMNHGADQCVMELKWAH